MSSKHVTSMEKKLLKYTILLPVVPFAIFLIVEMITSLKNVVVKMREN